MIVGSNNQIYNNLIYNNSAGSDSGDAAIVVTRAATRFGTTPLQQHEYGIYMDGRCLQHRDQEQYRLRQHPVPILLQAELHRAIEQFVRRRSPLREPVS